MKPYSLSKHVPYSRYLQFQEKSRKLRKESILFLEHPPTLTAGTNFKKENLLLTEEQLSEKGIQIYHVKRGGDFTAHEPGQLVIYPHIDLKKRNLAVTDFIHFFRDSIAKSIWNVWEISVIDRVDSPGLYLQDHPEKKLVSFGIYFKSFFTSFGAAINIENNLDTFTWINPCGGRAENIVSIQSLKRDPSRKSQFRQSLFHQLKIGLINRI
jgi:lipoyl(octanoyl) transferase